ncbi:MAG: nicotinate-nucleotide adenylyltransferase [Alphaproteobacteria bacterium]|nr:nicotinate-nucleotide adenylyltransferase [Alphaproteobacteria bacterium]
MASAVTELSAPGPVAQGLCIGLLGGSFNPAHAGHVHITQVALRRLGLDYVWWLVSPQNPLKAARGMAPLQQRLDVAKALFSHPRVIICDLERRLGTHYTVDTLLHLKQRFAGVHFVWLMGSDNLEQFHRWRDWQTIMGLVPVAVIVRPGSSLAALRARAAQQFARARVFEPKGFALRHPPAMIVLDGPRHPLSASAIRARRLVAARRP